MTKPVGRLTRAQLAPFEEEPKPQTPERLPAKTTEKPPSESPTTSQAKTGELSSPKVPEALTKRTGVLKVQLKPSKPVPKPQTATAPQRAGPSPVVPRAVKWDDVVVRLTTTATGGFEAEFTYARAGVQDTSDPAKLRSFVTAIDPFGLLKTAPRNTGTANTKYKTLDADQVQGFLGAASITGLTARGGKGARPAPDESTLDSAIGVRAATESGVPRLQHSIWVGGPLREDVPKQKAFMDRLVKNATDNPGWEVCLWMDQSRTEMLAATADSPLGKYRDWAVRNNIKLIPTDEVFGGANSMQLHGIFQLEQIKGGTGRAAASDILRLEIINRFGGVYCDGDKPINTPLADIAKHTATKGGGFTTAQEKGNFQNCGMCGIPGNDIVAKVLQVIQSNYGKPRDNLVPSERQNRPTRFEVILRTGPSVVRDVAMASEEPVPKNQADSKHLMPVDFITPPAVYTTSWDPSLIPTYGDRDLGAYVQNRVPLESSTAARNRVAGQVAQLRRDMQAGHADVAFTPEESAAQVAAVQKAVTAVVYGVWNNDGLFNMDLAEQHIKGAPDRDLAREMILKVFADPKMADVAQQVKTLQLPGNAATKDNPPSAIALPESTLDAIFRNNLFPNLDVKNFTLQHAAYMGNTQFIHYAREHGLVDMSAVSTRTIEVGQRLQGDRPYAADKFNVATAALRGGQRDVLALLSQYPEFAGMLDSAALAGQLDTMLWALHAVPATDRNKVDTADLLSKLLSRKRPEQSDTGATITVDLSDDECVYLFNQFVQGVQTETGAPPATNNAAYASLYQDAIEAGRTRLADRMEAAGASLANLPPKDRQALATRLSSSGADLTANRVQYLQLANKAGLVSELINGAASRQLPNLQTVKNDYATVLTDPNNAQQIMDYLAKGLAYAQSHIDDNNPGRGSRVDGWRTGVKSVVNLLGGISARARKPEQSAMLDAATLVNGKLQAMKRG